MQFAKFGLWKTTECRKTWVFQQVNCNRNKLWIKRVKRYQKNL